MQPAVGAMGAGMGVKDMLMKVSGGFSAEGHVEMVNTCLRNECGVAVVEARSKYSKTKQKP